MLREIKLKFGPVGVDHSLAFEPGHMTVFVGPNNAGKSLILREIEGYIESGGTSRHQIIDELTVDLPSKSEIEQIVLRLEHKPARNEPLEPTASIVVRKFGSGGHVDSRSIRLDQLFHAIDSNNLKYIFEQFIHLLTIRVDARKRFRLTDPQKTSDLRQRPTGYLMALLTDDVAREEVRQTIAEAFGLYFVINPLGMTELRIQMLIDQPPSFEKERSLDTEAEEFFKDAVDLSQW